MGCRGIERAISRSDRGDVPITNSSTRLHLIQPMSAATAQLLDGAAVAATIKRGLTEQIERLKAQGITPGLGTILVGDDPASATYVGLKHSDSQEIGIASFAEELPSTATQSDVLAAIERFNTNP